MKKTESRNCAGDHTCSKFQLQELRPAYPFVRGTRYRTVRHHLSHMRNMHEEKEANGEQILMS